jgi:hypothetical protein
MKFVERKAPGKILVRNRMEMGLDGRNALAKYKEMGT